MLRIISRIVVFPGVLLIRLYRLVLSPLLPDACRFTPSCSRYFEEALLTWGPFKGSWLGIRRILRCRPGGGSGEDPVPPRPTPPADPPASSAPPGE